MNAELKKHVFEHFLAVFGHGWVAVVAVAATVWGPEGGGHYG